jgi:hypothetical protein
LVTRDLATIFEIARYVFATCPHEGMRRTFRQVQIVPTRPRPPISTFAMF